MALSERQPPILIAHAKEGDVLLVGVNALARLDIDDQEMVDDAVRPSTRNEPAARSNRRSRVVERSLNLIVSPARVSIGSLRLAVPEANDDGPALGVAKADQRIREILARDPRRLTIKPLVLGKA